MKRFQLIILIVILFVNSPFLTFSQNTQQTIKTIVIDPGHGGADPGTVSKFGYEKDLVLDVSLKLGQYIEKYIPGVKVIYTRKTDVFVELIKRAEIANKANADLFISIHANGAENKEAFGTESFVMGLDKSAKNFAVVQKENEVIMKEDDYQKTYGNIDPQSPEAYIIFSLYQNVHLKQSTRLAQLIQNQFTERIGRKDRGVRQGPFFVLWKNESPSVLVELGFISHDAEARFLFSDKGKEYMASAIYRAFKKYKIELDGPIDTDDSSVPDDKPVIEPDTTVQEAIYKPVQVLDDTSQIHFEVQFLSSPKSYSKNSKKFEGIEKVNEYQIDGIYKYTAGHETNFEKVKALQTKVREKYPDAFVVAFKGQKKISITDALKELNH